MLRMLKRRRRKLLKKRKSASPSMTTTQASSPRLKVWPKTMKCARPRRWTPRTSRTWTTSTMRNPPPRSTRRLTLLLPYQIRTPICLASRLVLMPVMSSLLHREEDVVAAVVLVAAATDPRLRAAEVVASQSLSLLTKNTLVSADLGTDQSELKVHVSGACVITNL